MPLLLERLMAVLLTCAGEDNVIVHVEDPGAATVEGEHDRDEGTTTTWSVTVVDCCTPLSVAVTVAFCTVARVPVVAENVVLV